jgi:hypothetical protein
LKLKELVEVEEELVSIPVRLKLIAILVAVVELAEATRSMCSI